MCIGPPNKSISVADGNLLTRYWYNEITNHCDQIADNDRDRSENNFQTADECEDACVL